MGTKISLLPGAAALAGTEGFPVVQGGVTREALINQITNPVYTALAASSGSSLVGFINSIAGSTAATLQARGRLVIYPQDIVPSAGTGGDDTAAFTAAIAAASTLGLALEIPFTAAGYTIGPITIPGDNFVIISNGAWIFAKHSSNYKAYPIVTIYNSLIEWQGQYGKVIGKMTIDMLGDFGYRTALWNSANGAVDARYNSFQNIDVLNAQQAFMVGDPLWDTATPSTAAERGDSEVTLINCNTLQCFRAFSAYGANTIVYAIGSNLYTNYAALYSFMVGAGFPTGAGTLADYVSAGGAPTIELHGASLFLVGGGSCNFESTNPLIWSYPINTTTATYTKPYGHAFFDGAVTEAGYLFQTLNPNSLASTDTSPVFTASNTHGYVGGDNVLITTDALCYGGIVVESSCEWHGGAATQPPISVGIHTWVKADPTCFSNRTQSYAAFQAVQIISTVRTLFHATSSVQACTNTGTVLVQPTLVSIPDNYDSSTCYAVGTGIFTAPRAINTLQIDFNFPFTSGVVGDITDIQPFIGATGQVVVERFGGTAAGAIYLYNVAAGAAITIKIFSISNRTLNGTVNTFLKFTAIN